MPSRRRLAHVPLVALATLGLLAGCGSEPDDWSGPHADPTPVGELRAGFYPPSPAPPESTITPSPGSWDDVAPSADLRVVLLTYGDDTQTQVLVDAVEEWADEEDVRLKTVVPSDPDDFVPSIGRAMELSPDLIIAAGHDLVDPLAAVTANHLDQQFLVVGAELAEPTYNVTAADWAGASFRGEGLGMSSTYDPASFTPERAAAAVRAGVAAFLHGHTGIVIWLD